MTTEEFKSEQLTDAQRTSMEELQEHSGILWDDFLERCSVPTSLTPYVSVHDFHGMFVGIEPDGYTHT